jgi:hypothetical protein
VVVENVIRVESMNKQIESIVFMKMEIEMIWKKLCFTVEAFPEKERTRELNQAAGGALL